MNQIIIVALIAVLSGVVGFYGGRYYEQNTVRKRFQSRMMQNGQRNSYGQTSGSMRNRDFNGIPQGGNNFGPRN